MTGGRYYWRGYQLTLTVILYLTIARSLSGTAFEVTPPAPAPNPLAEQWILEQVSRGEVANLNDQFPYEAERIISAKFIEQLLTNSLKDVEVHRRGVRIMHAVVIEPINLENAEIIHETWLDNCRFEGKVNLSQSAIRKNLSFEESAFKEADFSGVKVEYGAIFNKATFAGLVDFSNAEITRNFSVAEAQFTNPEQRADFNTMRVGTITIFRKVVFTGMISMADSIFFDLLILDPEQADSSFLPLGFDLSRTMIKRELRLENARFAHLTATSIRVEGPTTLNALRIMEKLNLEHGSFQTLNLSNISWPRNESSPSRESVRLDGMNYEHISAGSEWEAWKTLVDLADQSAYSAQVYANLEAFFRRQGYAERADAIFIARRERERQEVLQGYLERWWNRLLGFLVDHGRSPGWAFVWSAIVVAIGCVVFFSKRGMDPQDSQYKCRHYNPLWYSLDLFIPVVELNATDIWIPKQNRWFARNYMHVQRILGWVLIPVGVAALTGIIK